MVTASKVTGHPCNFAGCPVNMHRDSRGQSKTTPDSAIGRDNEDFTLTPNIRHFRQGA